MAMGKRRKRKQKQLWVEADSIARSPGHPFYDRLSEILEESGFDDFVEELCAPLYTERVGRPSWPPGVYFRILLIGYFEGISSERGIAWRVADSVTLREFLGLSLTEATPNHSTISRTRRITPIEIHEAVFGWVLRMLSRHGLLRGKTLGIDATTLEANAALRSIVRRDTEESYPEYLASLAAEAGIETPTREELARFDRKRKKKTSNDDWKNPHDPDARITKMKDGRTRLAHKSEHVVDMDSGAIIGVTVQPADRGDTTSIEESLEETAKVLEDVLSDPEAASQLSTALMEELVADKGYHSNGVLTGACKGYRTYFSEPSRGRRRWKGKEEAQRAVYANRRRIRGKRGKRLAKKRGELLERPYAHCYGMGGLRRTHVRGHENIRKRILVHCAGFNLGLLMRQLIGAGKPRSLGAASVKALRALLRLLGTLWRRSRAREARQGARSSCVRLMTPHWTTTGGMLARIA